MKKIVLIVTVTVFTLTHLVAQDATFVKGNKVLDVGVGMGSISSAWTPVFSASFEAGIIDNIIKKGVIGVGGYLGYSSRTYAGWKRSNILIAGRGNFHYPLVKKMDTYAGLMIGWDVYSEKWKGEGSAPDHSSYGGFISTLFAGTSYYFSKNIAVMAELGLGYHLTYLDIGVSFKF